MASNLVTITQNVYIQYGNGIPTHISLKGSLYTDLNTAIVYINKDGISNWQEFGSVASPVTLQEAYNNSTTPEIVLNNTLGGLSIENGTGNPDSTTVLLEGINSSGQTTSVITAAGEFSGTSIYASDNVTTNDLHFNNISSNIDTSNNVNNWYFTGNFFSVAAQETNPQGVFFKTDGTKMYVNGTTNDRVYAYDLSTAWDITTSVYNGENYFLGTYDAAPTDLYISNDGLNFYSVGSSSDRVVQYTLGTPWNVSTATFVQFISTALFENAATGIYFKPDGTIMYIVGTQYTSIFSFSLSTPWDISTAVLVTSTPLNSDVGFSSPQSLDFSDDGTRLFVVGSTLDVIGEWYLPTPWDISVINFVNVSFRTSAYNSTPTGVFYSDSIQKAYIIGTSSDTVRSFDTNGGLNINSDSTYIGGQTIVEGDFEVRGNTNLNKALGVFGQSIMYSTLTVASTFQSNSSTRLTAGNGGDTQILNGAKSTNNAYLDVMAIGNGWGTNTTLSLNGTQDYYRNVNLLLPEYGTKSYLSIGYRNVNIDENLKTKHSGVIIIDSDAQEFNHTGSVNIGKVLQVENGFDFEQLDISGTTIFLDTFTEAVTTTLTAHTPDIGSGWDLIWRTSTSTTVQVTGGVGYAQSNATYANYGILYLAQDIPTSPDYEIKVTFKRQTSGDDVVWIIMRYQDDNNYYALRWSASYTDCRLLKKVGGVWSFVTPSTFNYGVASSTVSGVITTLTLRMIGNTLTVFNNDMYRGSWEDNDILTTGKFGFNLGVANGYNTTDDLSTLWYFDEFSVKEFDVPTLTGTTESYINGKLGVGITNPTQKLHVSGNVRIEGNLFDSTNSSGTTGQILSSTASGTEWIDNIKEIRHSTPYWSVSATLNTWQSWNFQGSYLTSNPSTSFGTGVYPSGIPAFIFLKNYKRLKELIFSTSSTAATTLQFLVEIGTYDGNNQLPINRQYIIDETFAHSANKTFNNFNIVEHELNENSILFFYFRQVSGGTTLLNTAQLIFKFE